MYCSIQEAWQDNDYNIKSIESTYNRPELFDRNIKEHFNEKNFNDCSIYLHHLETCEKCKAEFLKKNYINNIIAINPQIKETVIIFLIGLLILLIINLLYK